MPPATLWEPVWQDREIRFDTAISQLEPRRGEVMIDSINSVEDTKGNNGERGSMVVTNLRLVWVAHRSSRTNLSVGLGTVVSISIRRARSKLRGQSQALYLMTKFAGARFEFVFTSLVQNSPRIFTTTQSVLRAYETSKLYRDLKLRVSIVKEGKLLLLPTEEICSRIPGVWNLSSDQGNLGTMFVTNIRVVWHAHLAQNFNVSLPFVQVANVAVRGSKFGPALVLETSKYSGGYVLGFRVDPIDRLDLLQQEIKSLHAVYTANPNFGVDFLSEQASQLACHFHQPRLDDDCDIVDDDHVHDAVAAYYAAELASSRQEDDAVHLDARLGLAVQKPPKHTSLDQLWTIVPSVSAPSS